MIEKLETTLSPVNAVLSGNLKRTQNGLQCKEGCKDQESMQSSTTPDPGYQWKSDNFTVRHHKREQEVSPFLAGDHKAHINTDYRLMQVKYIAECPREHFAILLTFINLPFVSKTFVLYIFEWSLI